MVTMRHQLIASLSFILLIAPYAQPFCFTSYVHKLPASSGRSARGFALNSAPPPTPLLTSAQLSEAVRTIESGHVYTLDNYLPSSFISSLRLDAEKLYSDYLFEADGLASYTTQRTFDPNISRQVLKSKYWHNTSLGNSLTRLKFGQTIKNLRTQISLSLNRPTLKTGTIDYMSDWPDDKKKHEISYTRYSPLASLGRHTDEHSEMLKKREGWGRPTRRR